jgi:DNA (cytosine-5)-methyltransferase 1
LREGALLQTFPKNYRFIQENASFQDIAKQIGNAVPVNLAKAIGISIKRHLKEIQK